MEYYLENGTVETEQIRELIAARKIFPCYFGSALKMQGVKELLRGIPCRGATSCPDQLARAIDAYEQQEAK